MKVCENGCCMSIDEMKQIYACLISYHAICETAYKSKALQKMSAEDKSSLDTALVSARLALDIIEKFEKDCQKS